MHDDQCVNTCQYVIHHDPSTTFQSFHPADAKRFPDVENTEKDKGEGKIGEIERHKNMAIHTPTISSTTILEGSCPTLLLIRQRILPQKKKTRMSTERPHPRHRPEK
ncbi:MAG: hypothetical protein R2788_13545 [Saprospiraceae bacterium]